MEFIELKLLAGNRSLFCAIKEFADIVFHSIEIGVTGMHLELK